MAVAKTKKNMDKTMDAKSASLLKHLMEMELRRLQKEAEIDIIMFVGIDGRVFATRIPDQLSSNQYYLLNLTKVNLYHVCGQLKSENLEVSVQQYKEGTLVTTGVGDNAFLVAMFAGRFELKEMMDKVKRVVNASEVLKHIFELKPISDELIANYPEEVAAELKKLKRLLFVERFDTTREYKKNMEILNYIKKKLAEVVGVGSVDEVLTLTFNEMGTSAKYMKDNQWRILVEKIIKEHIQRMRGDIVADECYKTWLPAVDKKLKSFV